MKKSFLLVLLISGIYSINIYSNQESDQNLLIFKELGNNVFRTRTQKEYDEAAKAYITFANRYNYVLLLPTFQDVINHPKNIASSHVQVQASSSSSSTKPFKYPVTQPKKPSLLDRLKAHFGS